MDWLALAAGGAALVLGLVQLAAARRARRRGYVDDKRVARWRAGE